MNLSPEKMLVIAVLALLVLGPNRLPTAARSAGRALAQLRRLSADMQSELRGALAEPEAALHHAVDEFGIRDLRSAVRNPVRSIAAAALVAPVAAPGADAPSADGVAAPAPTAPAAEAARPSPADDPPPPDDPALN